LWGSAAQRLGYIYAHSLREKYLLLENWKILVSVLIVQYIHCVSMNAAYYMHIPREPLWDFGFEFMPFVPPETPLYLANAILSLTALFIVSPFLRAQSKPVFTVIIIARFSMVLILAQALRVVTFIVTTLPGPSEQCRPDSPTYNPPRDLFEVFFGVSKFSLFGVGCGDLVFSSSMIIALLCALTIHHYADPESTVHTTIKRVMWILVALFGLAQIGARTHYTLDILVASYTVPLLWLACLRHVPDRLPAEFSEPVRPVVPWTVNTTLKTLSTVPPP